MKLLVAYFSQTGNTKKIAKAVYEQLRTKIENIELKNIKKVKDLNYDLVFFGCPIQPPYPPEKIIKYLKKLKGKTALFITHAAPEGAPPLKKWINGYKKQVPGKIVSIFDCQGQLFFLVKWFMLVAPNPKYREWARHDNSKGQPDEKRLLAARKWAEKVINHYPL